MGFVSERIKQEDTNFFNSFEFKDVLGKPAKAYWWAIDKEKNIFLFPRGGGSFEIPVCFGLCINKDLVEIQVIKNTEGNRYDNNLKVKWVIKKIIIPRIITEMEYNEEEIRRVVKEAFIGLGTTGIEYTKIAEVIVEDIAEIEIKKEIKL